MNTRSCALAGLLVAVVLAGADGAWANNLTLTNVTIKPLDATRTCARFDLCWENSWRYTNINHDAAWVFFKIKPEGRTAWEHVTLETNGHDTGTGTAVEIIVPEDRVGCLIRRAEEGAGTVSVTNLKVAWNFASNSLVKTDRVRLQALALEMVYVAEGSFWVGDGTTENIHGHFEAGTNGTPFQITNEAYEIILGGGTAGSLGNNNGDGMATRDDFNDATSQTLPTNFPKGYAAFYCMKYEFTQGQYRDFLNTLTRAQQTTRTASQIANYFALSGGALAYRNGIRCPATVPLEPEPIVFGCDGNNNQVLNETDDAMDRACNFLSGAGDIYAFADWAGLRPMTELEYEKACRGPLDPVANEYAWGSRIAHAASGVLLNGGTGMERVTNGNCCSSSSSGCYPLRVGIFAVTNSTRQTSGASYWGIMELSGNVCEQAVTVGRTTGRAFTGLHGDGVLTAAGSASVPGWPPSSGAGVRGGLWNNGYDLSLRLSDRQEQSRTSIIASSLRTGVTGGRAARSAPAGVGP